jgi:hypothetical protein
MFMAKQQQVRLSSRFSRVCLFGCVVTLATIVFPHHVSANNLTICKKTVPPTGPTGPSFTFTGANSWPTSSGKDFTTAYVTSQLPSNPFQMQDTVCKTLDLTGHDQFNKITESVPPPPWRLTNISCTFSKSAVKIFGANPNPGFQPGDNAVSIDQADPNVTCTFVNTCAMRGQNLSTGVGSWIVTWPNGQTTTPHKVAPNSNWASHSPPASGGPPFPTGTSWVQPANSSTLTPEPPGDYVYLIRFVIPCPGTVTGWFAADNAATLVLDSDPGIPCLGNPTLCFLQANVTSFGPLAVMPGTHVIRITVTNQAGSNTLTGLLAHITVQ